MRRQVCYKFHIVNKFSLSYRPTFHRKAVYCMETMQAISTRKSQRSYAAKALGQTELELLVQAAQSAPKAGNFHITVITEPTVLQELNDKTLQAMKESGNEFLMSRAALEGYQPLYGAPALLLLSAPAAEPYAAINTACAATTITIAATGLGLGSCFVISPTLALAADTELGVKIGLPAGYAVICGMLAGYAEGEKFATHKNALNNVNYCK